MDALQRRSSIIGNRIRDIYLIKEYDDLNLILSPKLRSLVDTQLWNGVSNPISQCGISIDVSIRETINNVK